MDNHDQMMFTIWYGVYHTGRRELNYAGAGHPPVLLLSGSDEAPTDCQQLESNGPICGIIEGMPFTATVCAIEPGARIYVYSDGVFEILKTDGCMWDFKEFLTLMAAPLSEGESAIDRLHRKTHQLHGNQPLDDDFSILELRFPTEIRHRDLMARET